MAKKKDITTLSSQELYEIARQREQEEYEAEQAERQSQIDVLREERRQLIADHKKAVAAIDKEIRKLGGRAARGTGGRRGRSGGQSDAIMEIISTNGPISSSDLKAELSAKGMEVKHLSQQLNYLKRRGQITSPSRAVYAIA